MSDVANKCIHCGKYYIIIDGKTTCPFCKKDQNDYGGPLTDGQVGCDIFDQIFGKFKFS